MEEWQLRARRLQEEGVREATGLPVFDPADMVKHVNMLVA